jgi:hypothetical protein
MSVVAYYARVSVETLDDLRQDKDAFWSLPEMPWDLSESAPPEGVECLYLDKEWEVLAWLCSPAGRAEKRHETAHFALLRSEADRETARSVDEFKAAMAREAAKLGFTYVDPREFPYDPILCAIQGGWEDGEGVTIAGLGLSACVFDLNEVRALASALDRVDEKALRAHFDVDEMALHDLPIDEPSDFDEFCLPAFRRLKALYSRAANAGQSVVVVIS